MKKALVAGGTGLVGSFLLKALAADGGFETTALVRRSGVLPSSLARVTERVFDFDNPSSYAALAQESFDFVFCCLGTTRRKAGSAEQFRRVDFEYPSHILKAVSAARPVFALVSSVGADAPTGLYLNTKAELEKDLFESELRHVIVRPSLLLGERQESRPAETLGIKLFGPMSALFREHLGVRMAKYAPIEAAKVAQALLAGAQLCAQDNKSRILEGRELFAMANSSPVLDSASKPHT